VDKITLQGLLTSRIELRGQNTGEPYYYAFFKIPVQEQDVPVIFKEKPNLAKGSQLQLTGA
jgi:hypothetical protein